MSEETPEIQTKRSVPFKTATFGGYQRDEVDAYLDEVNRAAQRDRNEVDHLKKRITELEGQIIGNIPVETEVVRLEEELGRRDAELARLKAELEAVRQDEKLREGQSHADTQALLDQLRLQRDDLEKAQIEIAKLHEETETLKSERDSFQRLAEKLSTDEHQAKELLLAATKAAEELRSKARRDADDLTRRTEESVARMEEEARKRVDDLRREYERMRLDYDSFLGQARDVAQGLVRKMDDARAKWPV